jgi:hypothetical protein
VKHPLRGNIGAATVKPFSNARFPVVELRLNLEPPNAPAAVCSLRITLTVGRCIVVVLNAKKNRDCPSTNVVFVIIGSIAQPVERKSQQIPC